MSTSRAWTFTTRGSPRSVLSLASWPAPTLPPAPAVFAKGKPKQTTGGWEGENDWILVRVAYAALNPSGNFYVSLLPKMARAATATPELDLSGTVAEVWSPEGAGAGAGSKTTVAEAARGKAKAKAPLPPRFVKGDRVAAFIPISFGWPTGIGALAEHVVLPARFAVALPPHVKLQDASCVMTAGCTAAVTLRAANLKKGDRVLVNGASGGIGSLAVQMARAAVGPEGYVVGICSGSKVGMVKSLGVDEVLDYTASSPVSRVLRERFGGEKRFDAVVDCIGIQDVYVNCAGYLREEGTYSAVGIKPATQSYGGFLGALWKMQMNALWPRAEWLGGTGRKWVGARMMDPGRELMEEVVGMLADGRVKAVVDREVGFENAVEGYEVVGSGRAKGKVVVEVGGITERT